MDGLEQSGAGERGREDPVPLVRALLAGDVRALARAITLVEDGDPRGAAIVRAAFPRSGRASVIGVTGPPGAGKSTLIAGLTGRERGRGRSVAVLSVDPSSPYTAGAVLGDRVRLAEHFSDAGVFIRSMATRGAAGGLSRASRAAVTLMDAAGYDLVLLETVGVGQSELDVAHHADTVVLVLMPGAGDSVQAIKAGVMEIPDLIVVNKADRPGAQALVRELRAALALAPSERPPAPVIGMSAQTGEGFELLLQALDAHRARLEADGELERRRREGLRQELMALTTERLRLELEQRVSADARLTGLLERVATRELDPATAADLLLARGFGL